MNEHHYRALESMYHVAPINTFYRPTIQIADRRAEIQIEVGEQLCHAGGAVHGSVYFKMLDDAAFFAASSIETEVFVLTTSFTTYLTRPISSGCMRSVGSVAHTNRSQILAEAVVYDGEGRGIGRGNGLFVRSKRLLRETPGYKLPPEAVKS